MGGVQKIAILTFYDHEGHSIAPDQELMERHKEFYRKMVQEMVGERQNVESISNTGFSFSEGGSSTHTETKTGRVWKTFMAYAVDPALVGQLRPHVQLVQDLPGEENGLNLGQVNEKYAVLTIRDPEDNLVDLESYRRPCVQELYRQIVEEIVTAHQSAGEIDSISIAGFSFGDEISDNATHMAAQTNGLWKALVAYVGDPNSIGENTFYVNSQDVERFKEKSERDKAVILRSLYDKLTGSQPVKYTQPERAALAWFRNQFPSQLSNNEELIVLNATIEKLHQKGG